MKLLESLPPQLSPADEIALAERIQKSKKEDDINALALANMREAFLYSKRVCRSKIPDDEIFSLCYRALVRNAKRFNPAMGTTFMAFAKAGLRGAVCRYWETLDTVKHASMHEDEYEGIETDPGIPEIDDRSEFWESLQEIIGEKEGEAIEPEFQAIHNREVMKFVDKIIAEKLSDQEQMVLTLYYKSGFNLQEAGNLLGVTRSAVQFTHQKALRKIRDRLSKIMPTK